MLLVQQDFIDAPVQAFLGDRAVLHSLQDGGVGLGQGVWHQKYITARLNGLHGGLAGGVGGGDGIHRQRVGDDEGVFRVGDQRDKLRRKGGQFVFFGAGLGINYYKQLDWTNVPIYGAFRFMMPLSVAPYVDIKVGYSAGKIDGLYGSVGMGCRFPINGSAGFNIGVNLDLQHCDRQLMPSARSDYGYWI